MDPLIYSQKVTVKAHDINLEGFVTIPALLKMMQECSMLHSMQLKTSLWDMEEDKISWVLLKKEINIINHPKLNDELTILTYPSGFDKFFAFRDYLVFKDKKLIAAASSTWTLIDTETRKLSKIPPKALEIGVPKEVKFLSKPEKIKIGTQHWTEIDHRRIRRYDLDWNGHVNNTVLIRFCLEKTLNKKTKDEDIKCLKLHFKNEVKLDEALKVYSSDYYENTQKVKLMNSSEKVAVWAEVHFRNNHVNDSGENS